ncbi:TolB family protein [Streptosporangium sp. CA-135522]|uniref:TolB family protein n=1 Tax=Streptosporangium sp. CA-135522 TaxID=3240072 RepID=UPI003D8C74D3
MTELEEKLSRALSGAAHRAPQVPAGLTATVETRHRRRRARTAAVLAAAAVVVVAGGAGVAVNALRASALPNPAVSATDGAKPPTKPAAGTIPPPIEKVWPRAVHKIPARLPDGRAYYPQLLLDDHTLLVVTGALDGDRQFLWSYDLGTGKPSRIAEIPPTKGSAIYADGIAAGGGDIVWWASYKEPGGPRVARIWTVPVTGGKPRQVTDVPLGNVMKEGHINGLSVTGSDVVFAYEKGGVYRVPLSGGRPRPVKGAERHHILQWPWVGVHRGKAVFRELLNVETGERRDAVVKADEEVRCGLDRCAGMAVRYETVKVERPRDRSGKEIRCGTRRCPDTTRSQTVLRRFVRDRDGSRERELPADFRMGDDAGLERFFKVDVLRPGNLYVLTLYDADTGRSADLGIRPGNKGGMGIPDGGLDRLMTYQIDDEMYVLDLATIK